MDSGARGWGSERFMGTECQSGKMKESQIRGACTAMSVHLMPLNLKRVETVKFMLCVFYHSFKGLSVALGPGPSSESLLY